MNRHGGDLRPVWILALLLAGLFCATAVAAAGGRVLMYVGTYTGNGSEGIYAFRFDPATGAVETLGVAAKTVNPSFLAADPGGRFLYAVNEVDTFDVRAEGALSAFSIDRASGRLKFLQQVSSLGGAPAHLSLDRSARYLMVANYAGGNVAVFPIGPYGLLGRHTAFLQAGGSGPKKERQAGPHAHMIQATPDNRFALVADLGIDRLLVYDFDQRTGSLTADSARSRPLKPGSGPRHIAISPSGSFLYVLNELSSSVTAFAWDSAGGLPGERRTVSTLPDGFSGANTAAEIIVDVRGRFLYVSNRGDDSIVAFSIDPADGDLRFVQRMPCGGRTPRNIALDPGGRWLFSANQDSDGITLFRVGAEDGRLTASAASIGIDSPVCVLFIPD